MQKDLSKRKQALKKLLALADDGSFSIYSTSGDGYGVRAWPVDWSEPLRNLDYALKHKPGEVNWQRAFDKTLMNLTQGDEVEDPDQMKRELVAIQLALEGGANPNYEEDGVSLFNAFFRNFKEYGALEVAKHKDFIYPEKLDYTFLRLKEKLNFYLLHKRPYPGDKESERAYYAQKCAYQKDLVYTLFQKRMYPHDPQLGQSFMPIILEKDPTLFERQGKMLQKVLIHAKTDKQRLFALAGFYKERNL